MNIHDVEHHLTAVPIISFFVLGGIVVFELLRGIFAPKAVKLRRVALAMIGCALCLAAFPKVLRYVSFRELASCEDNVKLLAAACSNYANDNDGVYPAKLQSLVPKYLSEIPVCPTTRDDTYSKGFESAPNAYTVYCVGDQNHKFAGTMGSYPQYTSRLGLIPRNPNF